MIVVCSKAGSLPVLCQVCACSKPHEETACICDDYVPESFQPFCVFNPQAQHEAFIEAILEPLLDGILAITNSGKERTEIRKELAEFVKKYGS